MSVCACPAIDGLRPRPSAAVTVCTFNLSKFMEINVSQEPDSGVINATDQDFEAKVLVRSQKIPVLVDFWAPWCGPCKVIGPVLENLAQTWEGRFELVKVNMDESPALAEMMRIQSIPAVKLFINGAIHNEFVGALPEPEIIRFLEESIPSEEIEDAVVGMDRLQSGDVEGALRIFQDILSSDPKNPVALIGKGHILLDQGDIKGAREMISSVNEVELEKLSNQQNMEKVLTALKGRIFLSENADPEDAETAGPARKFADACRAALSGQFETALDSLFEIVQSDRKFKGDGGRLGMLAVFDMLPPDSDLTAAYRQKLSNFLFS